MNSNSFKNFSKKALAIFFILQILFPGWAYASTTLIVDDKTPGFVEGEVIVQYADGFMEAQKSTDAINTLLEKSDTEVKEQIEEKDIMVVKQESNLVEQVFQKISWIGEEEKLNSIISEYQADPAVKVAQPNFLYKIHSAPNDTYYKRQWYLENNGTTITGFHNFYNNYLSTIPQVLRPYFEKKIGLTPAGILSTADTDIDYEEAKSLYDVARARLTTDQKTKKVKVAVIDTGVDYNKADFQGKMWDGQNCVNYDGTALGGCVHGYNFPSKVADGNIRQTASGKYYYHGTSLASIIAANTNNSLGVAGIAPDAEIMALNVMSDTQIISTLDHIRAVLFAQENWAEILNVSLGSAKPFDITNTNFVDELLHDTYAQFPGLIINSAGNESTDIDNDTSVVYPAAFTRDLIVGDNKYEALKNLVVVGATTPQGGLAVYSNFGKNTVQISAPGSEIVAAGNEGHNTEFLGTDFDMNIGTSYAAPVVVGAAAFLRWAYPEKNLSEIKDALLDGATKNENLSGTILGGNMLNLAASMKILESQYNANLPLRAEILPNTTNWTNKDVVLTLAASEDIVAPEDWEKISNQKFVKKVTENSSIAVNIKTTSGKTLDLQYEVKNIDKNLPAISIEKPAQTEIVTKNFSEIITFSGSDSESGIDHFECQNNSATKFWCTSPYSFGLLSGENTFNVSAVDKAWNVSEQKKLKFIREGDAPSNPTSPSKPTELSVSQSGNGWSGPGGSSNYAPAAETNITNTPSANSPANFTPIINPTPTLNSASESQQNNFSENNFSKNNIILHEENIFNYSPTKTAYNPEEVEKILQKEWIREASNAEIRRFSVADKMIFLEKMIESGNIANEHPLELKQFPIMNTDEIVHSLKKISDNFIENWKLGKFFILDITKNNP